MLRQKLVNPITHAMDLNLDLTGVPRQPKIGSYFEVPAIIKNSTGEYPIVYEVYTALDTCYSCSRCFFEKVCRLNSASRETMFGICEDQPDIPDCMSDYRDDELNVVFVLNKISDRKI